MTSPHRPSRLQSLTKIALKTILIAALLIYLAQKGLISLSSMKAALLRWEIMLPTLLLYFSATLLGIIRWQGLLRAHDIFLSWSQVSQLTFIGNFFNIALPGAVSGDFVKAFYIGKELQGQRSKAFGSILFDRVTGLSALVLVSAGALFWGMDQFSHALVFEGIKVFLGVSALCVIFFYSYLFLVKEHFDPVFKLLKYLESKLPPFSSLLRVYTSLKHYHTHRLAVVQALTVSIIIHLIVGFCCLNLAQALGDSTLTLHSVYLVVPLGLLITAVPIAPAGVGTGNVAFLYLFHLLGSEHGGDTFSLLAVLNLLNGALGGLVYLRYKSQHLTHPTPSSMER